MEKIGLSVYWIKAINDKTRNYFPGSGLDSLTNKPSNPHVNDFHTGATVN